MLSGGPDDVDDIDDVLGALHAEYAAELPQLVETLAALVARAPTSPEAAAHARAAAHNLRGTAGSYGFPAVGKAAGEVEDAIEDVRADLPERMRALETLVRG